MGKKKVTKKTEPAAGAAAVVERTECAIIRLSNADKLGGVAVHHIVEEGQDFMVPIGTDVVIVATAVEAGTVRVYAKEGKDREFSAPENGQVVVRVREFEDFRVLVGKLGFVRFGVKGGRFVVGAVRLR